MSLGLLGQYGSVESGSEISESDEELPPGGDDKDTGSSCCGLADPLELSRVAAGKRTISSDPLALAGASESDSDGDTSEEEEDKGSSEDDGDPHATLPLPDLDQITSSNHLQTTSSVFSNPFKEAEKAKMDILKQHVDFDKPKTKGAKLTTSKPRTLRQQHPHRHHRSNKQPSSYKGQEEGLSPGDMLFDDSDSSIAKADGKNRKRSGGVGNALEPSKKVMRHHQAIQAKERPWTVQ